MGPQRHLEVGLVSVPGRHPNYLHACSSPPAPQQRGGSCVPSPPPAPRQPLCLRRASHTLAPRALPDEAIPPGARSWEPPGGSILAERGSFPLRGRRKAARAGEDRGCFSFPHWGNVGQVTSPADAAALSVRHPLWMAFLPGALAARTGDGPEGPSLPWLVGILREVPNAGRSGTGSQLGTWTQLVWDFGRGL